MNHERNTYAFLNEIFDSVHKTSFSDSFMNQINLVLMIKWSACSTMWHMT